MRITIIVILSWEKITQYHILSFYEAQINKYELINSNSLFILTVAGSGLLLIIWVSDRRSMNTLKSTLFNK